MSSPFELLAIITGLFLGYWVVGFFLEKKGDTTSSHNKEEKKFKDDRNTSDNGDFKISDEWFLILGVNRNASMNDITASYKKLIAQYHPDKMVKFGIEIQEVAEKKSKLINMAYSYAKKHR